MRALAKGLAVVLAALLVFFVGLGAASELGEVVVVRTGGGPEAPTSRLWVIDFDEGPVLRGSDGKAWVERLRAQPRLAMRRDGAWRDYDARELTEPAERERVRRGMAEKYGWTDWMIGLLRNTEGAVSFVLTPASAADVPSS